MTLYYTEPVISIYLSLTALIVDIEFISVIRNALKIARERLIPQLKILRKNGLPVGSMFALKIRHHGKVAGS
jgi:hypothetical protein